MNKGYGKSITIKKRYVADVYMELLSIINRNSFGITDAVIYLTEYYKLIDDSGLDDFLSFKYYEVLHKKFAKRTSVPFSLRERVDRRYHELMEAKP